MIYSCCHDALLPGISTCSYGAGGGCEAHRTLFSKRGPPLRQPIRGSRNSQVTVGGGNGTLIVGGGGGGGGVGGEKEGSSSSFVLPSVRPAFALFPPVFLPKECTCHTSRGPIFWTGKACLPLLPSLPSSVFCLALSLSLLPCGERREVGPRQSGDLVSRRRRSLDLVKPAERLQKAVSDGRRAPRVSLPALNFGCYPSLPEEERGEQRGEGASSVEKGCWLVGPRCPSVPLTYPASPRVPDLEEITEQSGCC